MAATSAVHFTVNSSETKRPIFFTSPFRQIPTKRFNLSCMSTKSPPKSPPDLPLTSTTLSNPPKDQSQLLSKPKSIWVNPAKPKRSVLSLQRQKRSLYSYNPQVRDLRQFAHKLNDCDASQGAFLAALEEIPHPPTRENALLILNSLKPWQKTHMFFNWVKAQNSFPMDTIFYNVTMKSLRFGRQFQLIEELAEEMVSNEIKLDNITYSTIITCAKRSKLFDKAVEWFERMYKTGLMPDEVTYSAILDVYAKLGKVEEVLSLYERGRASGWKPDPIAFSEMAAVGLQPNLVVYNTLLEAMGKAGKPGLARSLFEEMVGSGLKPNEKTLTALVKIYGKARWARDALELWERMRSNEWPMDFILYNTLLNMCADLGLEEEAKKLFEDMKQSEHCRPDSWSYTAMLNIFGSGGNVDEAMGLFEEMSELGIELNVMGCTCLIQCLGKARRFGDMVRVFGVAVERGVKPDDRLCGCLLSVVSLCEKTEDEDKVLSCLQQANPKLVTLVKVLQDKKLGFETIKDEFRDVISGTSVESRRPFCNCLIDICRNKNNHERLMSCSIWEPYTGCIRVYTTRLRGSAHTALEEWMGTLYKIVQREEALPELFSAQTGTGTHKFSQGLAHSFASHVEKLAAPFRKSEEKAGRFVATREDLVSWVQSQAPSTAITA
ncbi:pentatricopeptide repeat-containing protein [Prunus yedoensis var. nudiflora]|uniref:Pentatricopeptide repeat-containing protein n=1 Tax=Prunus yedoensis var. nudiflora TaxID=2094558 RepID=A0A314XLX5_PRUYE|nr:pentatricopeptide repeat-containing protein [Prunus yedoensis var. nudiflora]